MSAGGAGTGHGGHNSGHSQGGARPDLESVLSDLLAAHGRSDPQGAFLGLCHGAVRLLQATAVGILLTSETDELLPSATSGEPLTDALLREVAVGPGVQLPSLQSPHQIVIPDLRQAGRWPSLCSHALAGALLSMIVTPLLAEPDGYLGAIVVCFDRPGGLSAVQSRRLETLTAAAASIQRMNRRLTRAWRVAGELERALSTRVTVEQAKGFLAGRLGLSPDDAFHVLRGYARPRNEKVSEVARRVLDGSLEPAPLLRGGQRRCGRRGPGQDADGACA